VGSIPLCDLLAGTRSLGGQPERVPAKRRPTVHSKIQGHSTETPDMELVRIALGNHGADQHSTGLYATVLSFVAALAISK